MDSHAERVDALHEEALTMLNRIAAIIDELKGIESPDPKVLYALPSIEGRLGRLSDRAHVQGSKCRFVQVDCNDPMLRLVGDPMVYVRPKD